MTCICLICSKFLQFVFVPSGLNLGRKIIKPLHQSRRYGIFIKNKSMANTYTQIHLQIVFAVQNRASLILPSWKDELHKYITGIVQNNDHKMLIVNGMPDHLHLVIGMRPVQSLSDLIKHVKGDSSKWINEKGFVKEKFQWQEGFGAFSYSKSQLPALINYVQNQEIHHQKKTFIEEYKEFLEKFEVSYDERYIFTEVV